MSVKLLANPATNVVKSKPNKNGGVHFTATLELTLSDGRFAVLTVCPNGEANNHNRTYQPYADAPRWGLWSRKCNISFSTRGVKAMDEAENKDYAQSEKNNRSCRRAQIALAKTWIADTCEQLGIAPTFAFNPKAGCACGCSPAFQAETLTTWNACITVYESAEARAEILRLEELRRLKHTWESTYEIDRQEKEEEKLQTELNRVQEQLKRLYAAKAAAFDRLSELDLLNEDLTVKPIPS